MTPEERAARERKQKIFVVVGGLFMVVVLVFFTLPKLRGASSPAAEQASPTATTPVSTTDASPVALAGPAPVETGKLASLSSFRSKDPFVQQVVTQAAPAAGGDGAVEAKSTGKGETAEKPTTFSTGKTSASAVTIVTVNGARQVLEPGMKFPAADPIFVLVAERPGTKSVVVGIAGGAYSGGAKTTALKVGKPLTLVNTTTGARYKIALVSVGSGDAVETAAAPTP